MARYFGAGTIVFLIGMVLTRVMVMRRKGIPNWILLVYMVLGFWLFHRQALREEAYLREHYGKEYLDYCKRVRRYL